MKLKAFCLVLLALCLCIVPAAAETTYPTIIQLFETSTMTTQEHVVSGTNQIFTAPDGWVIAGFQSPLDCGDTINYTAYYGDQTISGSFDYQAAGWLDVLGTSYGLTLASQSYNETVLAIGYRKTERFVFGPGYAKNGSFMDYTILDRGFVAHTPAAGDSVNSHPTESCLFESAPSVGTSPVWKITVTSATYPTYVYVITREQWDEMIGSHPIGYAYDHLGEQSKESAALIDSIKGFAGTIWTIMLIAKYFAVDHFFEMLVLYEVVLMAYTAQGSRDIIQFLRKFVNAQTKLFGAILRMLEMIVNIVMRFIPGF